MNTLQGLSRLVRSSRYVRNAGTATNCRTNDAAYKKFLENQKLMQLEDGELIHLKGGSIDKALFMTTSALTALGLFLSFKFYYTMSFPRKG